MNPKPEIYQIKNEKTGRERKLANGIVARLFDGEKATISVVTIQPNTIGKMHSHPEEQWGYVLEGDGVRYQDNIQFNVKAGDLYRTPPDAKHTIKAGKNGLVVLDVFAPVREEYLKNGEGFGEQK